MPGEREITEDVPAGDFLTMPGHLLRRCHQIGVAVFLDECRSFDVTPLQYGALAALARFGAMDQASLGGVTALDRTTMLVVLTKLQERGLVTRGPSQTDRRSKIVSITEAGQELLEAIGPHVARAQEKMLAPLAARERTALVSLLARMADGNNALSRAPHRLP